MITTYGDCSDPRAIALLLHGGQANDPRPVTGRSLSWRRTTAMARAVSGPLAARGIGTWVNRNRVIGWNGDGQGRITDARSALDEVRSLHGEVPVVLVGHSMGGRVAVHVADDSSVVGVVGLAPWWPDGEPVAALAGRRLTAGHGSADKITSALATRAYVQRARAVAATAEFRDIGRVGHYMFRSVQSWNQFATSEVLRMLD